LARALSLSGVSQMHLLLLSKLFFMKSIQPSVLFQFAVHISSNLSCFNKNICGFQIKLISLIARIISSAGLGHLLL